MIGSGLAFEDRGEHSLKGVPDPWHLYALSNTPRDSRSGGIDPSPVLA